MGNQPLVDTSRATDLFVFIKPEPYYKSLTLLLLGPLVFRSERYHAGVG